MSSTVESAALSAAVDAEMETIAARWPAEVEVRRSISSVYHGLPFAFRAAFPRVASGDLVAFAAAARLYAGAILLADPVVDGVGTASVHLFRIMALQSEALRALQRLFPPDARFWERLQKYTAGYMSACLDESAFCGGRRPWSELTDPRAVGIALQKNGVSHAVLAGLAELDGDDAALARLSSALDDFNFATQMLDDVQDWKDDLRRGIPSVLLRPVLADGPVRPSQEAALDRYIAEAGRRLYYEGHLIAVLERAIDALRRAEDVGDRWPDLTFLRLVAAVQDEIVPLRDDLAQIIDAQLARNTARAGNA
jgi:hypothetical protein